MQLASGNTYMHDCYSRASLTQAVQHKHANSWTCTQACMRSCQLCQYATSVATAALYPAVYGEKAMNDLHAACWREETHVMHVRLSHVHAAMQLAAVHTSMVICELYASGVSGSCNAPMNQEEFAVHVIPSCQDLPPGEARDSTQSLV